MLAHHCSDLIFPVVVVGDSRAFPVEVESSQSTAHQLTGHLVVSEGESRVSLAPQRGIASDGDQTLRDLYAERVPLYERYGEIVVDCDEASPEEIAATIAAQLN